MRSWRTNTSGPEERRSGDEWTSLQDYSTRQSLRHIDAAQFGVRQLGIVDVDAVREALRLVLGRPEDFATEVALDWEIAGSELHAAMVEWEGRYPGVVEAWANPTREIASEVRSVMRRADELVLEARLQRSDPLTGEAPMSDASDELIFRELRETRGDPGDGSD
jgi:hypothetical protein